MNKFEDDKLEKADKDILFSKAVKAGKRVYYIDVKQDRKGELYISMTESKRLKEAGEDGQLQFEKHKLFLYREDFDKFLTALGEATAFARERSGSHPAEEGEAPLKADDFHLDIEF